MENLIFSLLIYLAPQPLIKYYLSHLESSVFQITDQEKHQYLHYADLGITFDFDKTLIDSRQNKKFEPQFIVSDVFDQKAKQFFPDVPVVAESVNFDKTNGVFVYIAKSRSSTIDTIDLLSQILTFTNPIQIRRIGLESELEKSATIANRKLTRIIKQPLDLIIETQGIKLSIDSLDILKIINPITEPFNPNFDIQVNKTELSKLLNTYRISNLSLGWVSKEIKDTLTKRQTSLQVEPIVLGADTGPNSDGTFANKYLEVDISQQKLFFFENGDLFKSYPVSTGLNYPTPPGNYKIKNKSPLGYSAIFSVWMPWWMAFDYRQDIDAYLGIHELPYQLKNGEKVYRFGNYIGNPKTGGCVALAPGDSKEVYDKSFPGMDLIIYP